MFIHAKYAKLLSENPEQAKRYKERCRANRLGEDTSEKWGVMSMSKTSDVNYKKEMVDFLRKNGINAFEKWSTEKLEEWVDKVNSEVAV